MPLRYLILIERDQTRREQLAAKIGRTLGLSTKIALEHATLLMEADAQRLVLPMGAGVIIGRIFSGVLAPKRQTSLGEAETARLQRQGPRGLISSYWGSYVSAIVSPDGSTLTVSRDPSGAVPVYYQKNATCLIMASDVDTLLQASGLRPVIDWAFVAKHIRHFDVATAQTALTGLVELLPGFSLVVRGQKTEVRQDWSPWGYVESGRSSAKRSDQSLASELRDTLLRCVGGLASSYQHLLLGLSGGLDSSIVASALAMQTTPWRAFTMATDEPTGDERRYARQVTNHLGVELDERFHTLSDVEMTRSVSAHLPRPTARSFGQSQNKVVAGLIDQYHCDAHFTGTGGDNVFCYLASATPILDRFMAEGLSFGVWETAQDICKLTGCSLSDALGAAYARSKHLPPKWGHANPNPFLSQGRLEEGLAPRHPWLDLPDNYLPGKAVHIAMLARAHGVMTAPPLSAGFDYVMPLVAQPVVELCLSIPSWRWCRGGVNRSLARVAFRDHLPPALIKRRSKGGPSRFCYDVIEAQRQALLPYLVEGVLSAHGIIDTDALKAALSGRRPLNLLDPMNLSQLAEAESWARHWSNN